jgi:hypothetical protein
MLRAVYRRARLHLIRREISLILALWGNAIVLVLAGLAHYDLGQNWPHDQTLPNERSIEAVCDHAGSCSLANNAVIVVTVT